MDTRMLCLLALLVVVIAPPQTAAQIDKDEPNEVEGMAAPNGSRPLYVCPPHFIRLGNSCYFLSRTMAAWQEAHFACVARKAQLAVFERRPENKRMRHYLQASTITPLERWIGGVYQFGIRSWVWAVSGIRIAYKAFKRRKVSKDWRWHCIAMDPAAAYLWQPISCLEPKHYICEAPLKKTPGHGRNHGGSPPTEGRGGGRRPGNGITGHSPSGRGRHRGPQTNELPTVLSGFYDQRRRQPQRPTPSRSRPTSNLRRPTSGNSGSNKYDRNNYSGQGRNRQATSPAPRWENKRRVASGPSEQDLKEQRYWQMQRSRDGPTPSFRRINETNAERNEVQ